MQIFKHTCLKQPAKALFLRITLLCICLHPLHLAAQSTDPDPLSKYQHLNKLENDGQKTVLLANYAAEMLQLLSSQKGDLLLSDTLPVKQVWSEDRNMKAFYYIAKFKNQPRRLELFLSYNHNGTIKSSYSSEELRPSPTSKEGVQKPLVNATISQTKLKDITYYQFKLKEGSQTILAPIGDLYTKALFEEVTQLTNDSNKLLLNQQIIERLKPMWEDAAYFEDMFSGFPRMSVLLSSDKKVKLVTWNTALTDATHVFWGAAITRSEAGKTTVTMLTDKTNEIRSPERTSLTPKKWYGAIYYDLIETEYKKQKYYTLLGFKGNNEFTKIKVIEVLTVDGNMDVRFNSSIISKGLGFQPRAIYEYSMQANMMLKYDTEHKMIVMDNLLPSSPVYKEMYMYYGPDFSYNGLKFEKGKWVFYADIDLRNPKTK